MGRHHHYLHALILKPISLQLTLAKTIWLEWIMLCPGSKPMKLEEIQSRLQSIWHPTSSWLLTPFAQGFFDTHFEDEIDMRNAWNSVLALCTDLFTGYISGSRILIYMSQISNPICRYGFMALVLNTGI